MGLRKFWRLLDARWWCIQSWNLLGVPSHLWHTVHRLKFGPSAGHKLAYLISSWSTLRRHDILAFSSGTVATLGLKKMTQIDGYRQGSGLEMFWWLVAVPADGGSAWNFRQNWSLAGLYHCFSATMSSKFGKALSVFVSDDNGEIGCSFKVCGGFSRPNGNQKDDGCCCRTAPARNFRAVFRRRRFSPAPDLDLDFFSVMRGTEWSSGLVGASPGWPNESAKVYPFQHFTTSVEIFLAISRWRRALPARVLDQGLLSGLGCV